MTTLADPARPQEQGKTGKTGNSEHVGESAQMVSLSARLQQVEQERDQWRAWADFVWGETWPDDVTDDQRRELLVQNFDYEHEQLKAEIYDAQRGKEATEAALVSAREQIAQLQGYVQHKAGCAFEWCRKCYYRMDSACGQSHIHVSRPCTCGLSSVLSGASAPESTK